VYENGSVYPVHVLDLTPEDLMNKFIGGVRRVAALSLALNYRTPATVPYLLSNGFKKMVAIALESGYSFKEIDQLKSAGSAAPSGAPAKDEKNAKKEAKKEEPKEEPKEEEEMEGVFGLFD